MTQEGYRIFTEQVVPLLSVIQKNKHFEFSKKLLTNWRKGTRKFVLMHYDENSFESYYSINLQRVLMIFLKVSSKHTINTILLKPWI